jgi:DNA-nicking Smr family endonuclease
MNKKEPFHRPFADLKNLPIKVSEAQAPERAPQEQKPTPTPKQHAAPREQMKDVSFFDAMQGVTRLSDRMNQSHTVKRSKNTALGSGRAIPAENDWQRATQDKGAFIIESEGEHVWGRASGLNLRTLKELRRGKHPYRRQLDLHGHRVEGALSRLLDFCESACLADQRSVLIVTGKGMGSPDGVSVLRESLPQWLSTSPLNRIVLAFSTALLADGGTGAFYVLLKRVGSRHASR